MKTTPVRVFFLGIVYIFLAIILDLLSRNLTQSFINQQSETSYWIGTVVINLAFAACTILLFWFTLMKGDITRWVSIAYLLIGISILFIWGVPILPSLIPNLAASTLIYPGRLSGMAGALLALTGIGMLFLRQPGLNQQQNNR